MAHEALQGRSRPLGLPNFSTDGGGNVGKQFPDPLKKYEWTPLKDYFWCGDALMNQDLMGRGYTLVNTFFAERYKKSGKVIVPRKLSPQEQLLSQFEIEERSFVVVAPEAADLRLIPHEFMQNPRVARQQTDDGYENLGTDTESRYIMVRTKSLEERLREQTVFDTTYDPYDRG